MAYMKGTAASQSKFPFSLLHTPYANEAYELMHDPTRIITLPAGLKAGIICGVAYGGTEEHNIVPLYPVAALLSADDTSEIFSHYVHSFIRSSLFTELSMCLACPIIMQDHC